MQVLPVLLVFCCIFLQQNHGSPLPQHSYGSGLKGGSSGPGLYPQLQPSAPYLNPKSDAETISHGYNPNVNFRPTNFSRPSTNTFGTKNTQSFRPLLQGSNNNQLSYNIRAAEAKTLHDALYASPDGVIDSNAIINVLARKSFYERMEVASMYQNVHKSSLINDFEEKLTGWFKDLMIAIMTPTPEFLVKELYDATQGPGTDEDSLIDILCSLSNVEIRNIERIYEHKYGATLQSHIEEDTSGTFRSILLALANAERDESLYINKAQTTADAQQLLEAGKLKWGTDEPVFVRILTQRNYRQLREIAGEYERIAGHSLKQAIEDEFSGYEKQALLAILQFANSPPAFFAQRLHKSVAGSGTNNKQLIRVVTMRREIDMELIKMHYKANYDITLQDAIIDDTSGEYKDCLLALVGNSQYYGTR